MATISKEEIDKHLTYNQYDGSFRWKYRSVENCKSPQAVATWNTQNAGQIAGHIDAVSGNRRIMIMGVQHYARRLAYITMTGKQPKGRVVHRDGDKRNLEWDNLTTEASFNAECQARPPLRMVGESELLINGFLL